MPTSRVDLLRWQFDLTWSLFEYHLDRLDESDALWQPATVCWTVHRSGDGRWYPDWSEEELDPVPVPTIAWITWHIGWWWSVTIDHVQQRSPRGRTEIPWPGDAASAVEWLRDLRAQWTALLDGLVDEDLDAPATFPWSAGTDLTIGHTAAWLNTELAKNVSEIGQLRLVRAAA